jgi:hypothetical protein
LTTEAKRELIFILVEEHVGQLVNVDLRLPSPLLDDLVFGVREGHVGVSDEGDFVDQLGLSVAQK